MATVWISPSPNANAADAARKPCFCFASVRSASTRAMASVTSAARPRAPAPGPIRTDRGWRGGVPERARAWRDLTCRMPPALEAALLRSPRHHEDPQPYATRRPTDPRRAGVRAPVRALGDPRVVERCARHRGGEAGRRLRRGRGPTRTLRTTRRPRRSRTSRAAAALAPRRLPLPRAPRRRLALRWPSTDDRVSRVGLRGLGRAAASSRSAGRLSRRPCRRLVLHELRSRLGEDAPGQHPAPRRAGRSRGRTRAARPSPPCWRPSACACARSATPTSAPMRRRYCADLEVMRWLGGRRWSRTESWRHVAMILGHWRLRGHGMWAVERRSDGELIGRVGCIEPDGWPGFEIGWMIPAASTRARVTRPRPRARRWRGHAMCSAAIAWCTASPGQ